MNKVKQIQPTIDPSTLSDEELLLAHMTTHAYYKEFRRGREKEGWTLEQVVQTHDDIRMEISQREDIEHEYVNALDSESVNVEQGLEIHMGHKDSVAKEWAEGLLQADDADQHIRENPPEASWYPKAVEFIQKEDSTLDPTEYVEFADISYDNLDESIQEWVQSATGSEVGAVGYYFNEDTETGVLFINQDDGYSIYVDNDEACHVNDQISALEQYQEATWLAQDGVRGQRVIDKLNQQDNWVIPSNPDSYDLADPDTSWSDVDTTMSAYLSAEDSDAESWEDASEEVRQAITSYHSASASGNPADNFSDLWGPHHGPGGEVVYNGVVAAKAANSGARSEPNTPTSIRDDIDSHLNGHVDEFADEYEEVEETQQQDDLEQGRAVATDMKYDWYVWDQEEAESWLQEHNFEVPEPEMRDGHAIYQQTEPEGLFDMFHEWRGPVRHRPNIIPEVDGRPILFVMGYPNEEPQKYENAVVQNVSFRVEQPVASGEMEQASVDNETDKDWYWYKWNRTEINVWAQERDIDIGVGEREGDFVSVEMNSPERYDELETVWEGRRNKPDDSKLPGGDKPRRVTYGVTSQGDREIQKIDFRVGDGQNNMKEMFYDK